MLFVCVTPDYSYDFNVTESDSPPTTYLPEDFTYLPSQVCPERLPSMSKRILNPGSRLHNSLLCREARKGGHFSLSLMT